jgi:hypothetical protein
MAAARAVLDTTNIDPRYHNHIIMLRSVITTTPRASSSRQHHHRSSSNNSNSSSNIGTRDPCRVANYRNTHTPIPNNSRNNRSSCNRNTSQLQQPWVFTQVHSPTKYPSKSRASWATPSSVSASRTHSQTPTSVTLPSKMACLSAPWMATRAGSPISVHSPQILKPPTTRHPHSPRPRIPSTRMNLRMRSTIRPCRHPTRRVRPEATIIRLPSGVHSIFPLPPAKANNSNNNNSNPHLLPPPPRSTTQSNTIINTSKPALHPGGSLYSRMLNPLPPITTNPSLILP